MARTALCTLSSEVVRHRQHGDGLDEVVGLEDGLHLSPRQLSGGVFHTYGDHRMAMAAAILGLVVPGVLIEDVATTGKTMPDFVTRWEHMLAGQAAGTHPS